MEDIIYSERETGDWRYLPDIPSLGSTALLWSDLRHRHPERNLQSAYRHPRPETRLRLSKHRSAIGPSWCLLKGHGNCHQ